MKQKTPETGCAACPLAGHTRVPGEGPEDARLVIVGEAPGAAEIRERRPFVGPSGKVLDSVLRQAGVNREDVYITNAILCMENPPRSARAKEVFCCRERLIAEVCGRRPKVILALGKVAVKALLGINQPMKELRGAVRWANHLEAHVVPTYHPAHILRSPRLHRDLFADVAKAKSLLTAPPAKVASCDISYVVASGVRDVVGFLRKAERAPAVALDTETASDGALLCLGLSAEPGKALVIPQDVFVQVRGLLKAWLPRLVCVGQGLKHDIKVLRSHGVPGIATGGDTMLQAYVINPLVGGHGLKQLVREHLDYYEDYSAPIEPFYKHMEDCPRSALYEYNAKDAALTLVLYHTLEKKLDENHRRVLEQLLYPASDALADMEYTGVLVDRDYLHELEGRLAEEIEILIAEMQKLVGRSFNPNSPKQLAEVMYDGLGLPIPVRRSTDKDALDVLHRVHPHPFVEKLVEYRSRHKFLTTYVRKLLAASSGPDGRVRTTFNLHTTATGRLSSSSPLNLQNIPRTGEARNAFIATPGYTLVEGDLEQAEVRCWAWYSRDEALRRAIVDSGADVHTTMASAAWRIPPENVTPELRQKGKRLVFGTMYGMDAGTVASQLDISLAEAQELQQSLFQAYPQGRRWMQERRAQVLAGNDVFTTPFGRKLYLAGGEVGERIRQSINYPIQSLASDLTLAALIRLHRGIKRGKFGNTRLLLTVHDSILLETAENAVEVAYAVKEEMEREVLDGWMPFTAETKTGEKWGSLQKIE